MSSKFRQTRIQKRDKKEMKIFQVIMVIFTIIGVAIYGIFAHIKSVAEFTVPEGKYTIQKGITLSNMNEKFEFGINPTRYKAWIKFYAPEKVKLPIGTYTTQTGVTLTQFFTETIQKPPHNDLTVKILPGWNRYDIDNYLAKNDILPAGDFLRETSGNMEYYKGKYDFLQGRESLEGFLMPDTYRIFKNSNAKNIVNKLLSGFENRIGEQYKSMGPSAYNTLILASIVEEEDRSEANRATVAGVLAKRVREGIPIGADATVCIGYKKTNKDCTPAFIGSVIYKENPYNTRKTQGYPPTPISSVSLSAWKAAANPKESPYYYYIHDNNGKIHYGKDGNEHNANVQKYLR